MLKQLFILFVSIFLSVGLAVAEKVPSSTTSEAALKRVKLILDAELKKKSLQFGAPIFIRIFKEEKELELWIKKENVYKLFKTYKICYFSGFLGPKEKTGDNQSPEGFYSVSAGQLNPYSNYHLAFNLGYPNSYDRSLSRTGSALMVHGNCVSIGCYAMTDAYIDEIYSLASQALIHGQPSFSVHVFPFRMTDANMSMHKESKWFEFWQNLKEGYDYFAKNGVPPKISVRNKKYLIS